jgi:hypothetical protein
MGKCFRGCQGKWAQRIMSCGICLEEVQAHMWKGKTNVYLFLPTEAVSNMAVLSVLKNVMCRLIDFVIKSIN